MGLFSRKPQPAPQPARQLAAPLAAEKEIIVVATEHYTDLRRVPVGPVSGVTIQPEPTNPHDRNAVLVCWGGQRVGYLSAARARTYRPLLTGVHPVDAHVKATGGGPELFVMLTRVSATTR